MITPDDIERLIGNPLREKREGPGRVSDAGPGPHFPTPSGSRTETTVAQHRRDPDAAAVYIRNVGTAFRCECGRYYVGGYGCPADKSADPPSAKELEGWWHRAAVRVVRTYADAPDYLQAEARIFWPSLGDALDMLARIDALAELADDAE